MLSNDTLSFVLFLSVLVQCLYIRSLTRLNDSLFDQYKVKNYYFYLYPMSIIIYYMFIITGLFKYSSVLNISVMLGLPLFSFLTFVTGTLYLLWGSKKMLSLFSIKEKYFFMDTGGLGLYVFVIALFFGTYLANYAVIALFIIAAITHWIFINTNYKFLNKKLNKKI